MQFAPRSGLLLALPVLVLAAAGAAGNQAINRTSVNLGFIFPQQLHPQFDARGHIALIELALEHINSSPDILPNTTLVPFYKDTMYSSREGFFGTLDLAGYCESDDDGQQQDTRVDALVGAVFSGVTINVATVAAELDLAVLSPLSASTTLSDPVQFPTYSRLIFDSNSYGAVGITAIVRHYGWTRVATLTQTDDNFSAQVVAGFTSAALEQENPISIAAAASFAANNIADIKNALTLIKASDARIILLGCFVDQANVVFAEAEKMGMRDAYHAWMGTAPMFVDVDLMQPQFAGCVGLSTASDVSLTAYQLLNKTWSEATAEQRRNATDLNNFHLLTWDTVFFMARSIERLFYWRDECERLDALGMSSSNAMCVAIANKPDTLALVDAIRNTTMHGASGPVRLDQDGNRLADLDILNVRRVDSVDSDELVIERVGLIDIGGQVAISDPIQWTGRASATTVPNDGPIVVDVETHVEDAVFYFFGVIASLLALFCVIFTALTIKYWSTSIIRLSSPKLNMVSTLGCLVLALSVWIWGLDMDSRLRCELRAWCTTLSVTLAFVPLFAKTYRVHVLFSNNLTRKRRMTDTALLGIVGLVLIVDVFVLALWTGLDPPTPRVHFHSSEATDNPGVRERSFWYMCHSDSNGYVVFIVIFKFVAMFAGVVLAYSVRGVKIRALNDSNAVGIAVYNFFFVTIITVPVSVLVWDELTPRFVLVALCLTVTAGTAIVAIHLLKFVAIFTGKTESWTTTDMHHTNITGSAVDTMATAKHVLGDPGSRSSLEMPMLVSMERKVDKIVALLSEPPLAMVVNMASRTVVSWTPSCLAYFPALYADMLLTEFIPDFDDNIERFWSAEGVCLEVPLGKRGDEAQPIEERPAVKLHDTGKRVISRKRRGDGSVAARSKGEGRDEQQRRGDNENGGARGAGAGAGAGAVASAAARDNATPENSDTDVAVEEHVDVELADVEKRGDADGSDADPQTFIRFVAHLTSTLSTYETDDVHVQAVFTMRRDVSALRDELMEAMERACGSRVASDTQRASAGAEHARTSTMPLPAQEARDDSGSHSRSRSLSRDSTALRASMTRSSTASRAPLRVNTCSTPRRSGDSAADRGASVDSHAMEFLHSPSSPTDMSGRMEITDSAGAFSSIGCVSGVDTSRRPVTTSTSPHSQAPHDDESVADDDGDDDV